LQFKLNTIYVDTIQIYHYYLHIIVHLQNCQQSVKKLTMLVFMGV